MANTHTTEAHDEYGVTKGQQSGRQTDTTVDLAPGRPDAGKSLWIRCLMQVLWPAFIGAVLTVGLVFSLIDPHQIEWVHLHLNDSRQASYTLGFIMFWALYIIACSVTWYLTTTDNNTNNSQ